MTNPRARPSYRDTTSTGEKTGWLSAGSSMVYQHGERKKTISPLLNAILSGAIGVPDAEGMAIQQCKAIVQLHPDAAHDRDEHGNGALHCAMKRGWLMLAQYLIEEEGLSVDDEGEAGQQPIHWASAWASVRAVSLLASHGASLEARCADGCVPLHFAAMHGQHTMVYYLLSKGCSIDAVDSQGYTALHRAACRPHHLVVKTILDYGKLRATRANLVNQRDLAGRNALHWATTTPDGSSKHAVICALLDAGCDVSGPAAADSEGRDVLAYASYHGFERTAKHIEEYIALGKTRGNALKYGRVSESVDELGKEPAQTCYTSKRIPLSWAVLGLSTIRRNVCGGKRTKGDVGVMCVMWFYSSISCGVWVWWNRFVAQDGLNPHLMLTIMFLVFLVAEVVAYTAMVHSSPGFLAMGSRERAESTRL